MSGGGDPRGLHRCGGPTLRGVIAMGTRMQMIERCAVPVVAAVTGDVYGGGCELVLLCDAVFAEEGVSFSFRHARMGLAPAWGGASRLLERVGTLQASRLLLGAAPIEAARRPASPGDERRGEGRGGDESAALIEQVAGRPAQRHANKMALLAAREAHASGAGEDRGGHLQRRLWAGPRIAGDVRDSRSRFVTARSSAARPSSPRINATATAGCHSARRGRGPDRHIHHASPRASQVSSRIVGVA